MEKKESKKINSLVETYTNELFERMSLENLKDINKEWLQEQLSFMYFQGHLEKFKDKPNQVLYYLKKCYLLGKNPLLNEIYAVPFGDTIQTIIDYKEYIKAAEQDKDFQGYNTELVFQKPTGELLGANDIYCVFTCKRKNSDVEYKTVVFLRESRQNTPMWNKAPMDMLQKTAIKRGLARAFASQCGTFDSIEQGDFANVENSTNTPKKETILKVLGETNE